MLKSWSIQNFKPILDSGELKLAPVTVLAGRNSSGKSSLIQSILMIAQTLSSRVLDRPLLPHGSFAHLGTFEDIINKYSGIRTLTIGFQLEIEKEELTTSRRFTFPGESPINWFGTELTINSVKITAQFLGATTDGASSSAIEASKVSVENVSLEVSSSIIEHLQESINSTRILRKSRPFEFGINIKKLTNEELADFLGDLDPEYLRLVPNPIKEANYLANFKVMDQAISNNVPGQSLVTFSHFLPTRLIVKFKVEERRRQRLMIYLNRFFEYPTDNLKIYRSAELFEPDAPLSRNLSREILEFCKNEKIPEAFTGESLHDLANWYKALRLGRGRKKGNFGTQLQKLVAQDLMEQTGQSRVADDKTSEALESMANNIYVENLEHAVEQITRFFTSKIRYLGPLRADPDILQGFSPSSELDDVGSKGQYAATVYDANQNAQIRWYNPINQKIEQSTLRTALNVWARYLGVAHEIKIEIAGQSGVSWQVVQLSVVC